VRFAQGQRVIDDATSKDGQNAELKWRIPPTTMKKKKKEI
jgi:hypothetical protein